MQNPFLETLQTINKAGNVSNNLLSQVMISGLETHVRLTDVHNLEGLLEFLYKSIENQNILSPSGKMDVYAKLVSILEELKIPLKLSQIHYLIAGIDSVTIAMDLSYQQSLLGFAELLKVVSFFSTQAAAVAINDKEIINRDIVNDIDFPSDAEFSKKYVAAQEVLYPMSLMLLCEYFIKNKLHKCSDLGEFSRGKTFVLNLKDEIEKSLPQNTTLQRKLDALNKEIKNLNDRENDLRNHAFIELFRTPRIVEILTNDKYKQELRSSVKQSDKTNHDVFSSPLSSILYTTKNLSSVRFKLKEIVGREPDDESIKSISRKCYEISRREKSIQERIGSDLNKGTSLALK